MHAGLKHGLFLLALVLVLGLSWTQRPNPALFAEAEFLRHMPKPAAPLFETRQIPPAEGVAVVHSGTLAELSDGRLLAAWFGGSREGAADVDIQAAHWQQGAWDKPFILLSREQAAEELGRPLRKLGNPVLHKDADKRLWLFFVTVSLGGWSTSSISYKISGDDGRSWTPARRLVSSPFANMSTLVRSRALNYADGSIALPVYHELAGKFGELLRIDRDGKVLAKSRIGSGKSAIQPSLIARGPVEAEAFLRRTGNSPRRLMYAQSDDGGANWTTPLPLELHNPDASVAVESDAQGRALLVHNPLEHGRHLLVLDRSADNDSWSRLAELKSAQGDMRKKYSYPFLIRTGTGEFHLIYTHERSAMTHVRFNQAWLEQQP